MPSGCHVFPPISMASTTFAKGHPRIILTKLYWNWTGRFRDSISPLSDAAATILVLHRISSFEQFLRGPLNEHSCEDRLKLVGGVGGFVV